MNKVEEELGNQLCKQNKHRIIVRFVASLELRILLMEAGIGIVGYAFQMKVTLKKVEKMMQKCINCGAEMKVGRYEKAKFCANCNYERQIDNAEIKKVFKDLQKRNSKMTPEELEMNEKFEDDPRAKTEQLYGKVSKVPDRSYYSPVSSIDDESM